MSAEAMRRAFIAHAGARAEEAAECEHLADRLEVAYQAARARWPLLDVPPESFARWLAERVTTGVALAAAVDAMQTADLYLACALAAASPQAITIFEGRFLPDVARYIAHLDSSPGFADEVRQRLRERLLVAATGDPPRIAEYAGRGPLAGLVRVAAVRIALNLKRGAKQHTEPDDELIRGPGLDPETAYLRARYQGEFEEAYRAAIEALDPEERTLLRLHHLDGVTLDDLAALHKVHRTSVARRLAKARRQIVDETNRTLVERLNLSPTELAGLRALVRSQLNVSIRRLFGARQ
jgi:RNA polymerase sigma-70 factor (ECF subfamily)